MLPVKKVKALIHNMNAMSESTIAPMKPIIEMFNMAMDEKMLDYLLKLGTEEYTMDELETIYVDMYKDGWLEFKKELLNMCFVHPSGHDKPDIYELSAIFPGWVEFYTCGELNDKRAAIVEKFMEFYTLLKTFNVFPIREVMNKKGDVEKEKGKVPKVTVYPATGSREIVLDKPLESKQVTLIKNDVYEILRKNKDSIGIANCFCRTHKKLSANEECDLGIPNEACMAVGPLANQIMANGSGRKLTFEEASEILEDFEKKGCIHTAFHFKNNADYDELVICNCCKDCCLLYKGYQEGELSLIYTRSSYVPKIKDESKCVGCNLCARYCPTDATYFDKESHKLVFHYERCIGCGQCVSQCHFDVREMVPDLRDVFVKSKKRGT